MRKALWVRHYSIRTETSYLDWAKRFTLRVFHHKRHPETMGAPEITAFLTHLAVEKKISASTQTQALYGSGLRLMECLRLRVKLVLSLPKETWTSASARSSSATAKA